jgi:hypothetical protein
MITTDATSENWGKKTAGTSVVRFWFLGQLPRIDIASSKFWRKKQNWNQNQEPASGLNWNQPQNSF